MSFHDSRAAQMAQCRAECEDHPGNHCYLGDNDIGCVIGEELLPSEGSTRVQCCKVNADIFFIQTVRHILAFADQVQDVGTSRARIALSNLLDTAEFHHPPVSSHFELRTLTLPRSQFDTRAKDLLNLLDLIVPHSIYAVSAGLADVLEQPESRRRKGSIYYKIRQSDWSESHFPNDVLTVATHMQISIDQIDYARLDVYLQNLLEIRQPRPTASIRLSIANAFATHIRQRDIDRIWGYLGSSLFRGRIVVEFTFNNLANDVFLRDYRSPPSETVSRLLRVTPAKLLIVVN